MHVIELIAIMLYSHLLILYDLTSSAYFASRAFSLLTAGQDAGLYPSENTPPLQAVLFTCSHKSLFPPIQGSSDIRFDTASLVGDCNPFQSSRTRSMGATATRGSKSAFSRMDLCTKKLWMTIVSDRQAVGVVGATHSTVLGIPRT